MKSKIVLWGKDSNDTKSLIALQLNPEESKIDTWVFSGALATEELGNQLLFDWRDDKKGFEFPEGFQKFETELTVAGTILPEGFTVDKPDLIQRAQTEWHFMVLSSKLNASYQSELEELEERIFKLEGYSSKLWEDLKIFWGKVSEQMRERNLFRDHSIALKERTNALFTKLKELRSSLDAEFKAQAEATYNRFSARLGDVEERVAKNINLYNVFEELKEIQRDLKTAKLTKDLRNDIWKRLDHIFKSVKEKRFGNTNPTDRLSRRYDGLMQAIKKMENSIGRDREDLEFQHKKINSAYTGQLETQIRQAKTKMIEERISSKQAKLDEMYKTKVELEEKTAKAKARQEADAKRAAKKEADAAARKAEAAAKEAAKAAEVVAPPVVETPEAPVEVKSEEVKTETPTPEAPTEEKSE